MVVVDPITGVRHRGPQLKPLAEKVKRVRVKYEKKRVREKVPREKQNVYNQQKREVYLRIQLKQKRKENKAQAAKIVLQTADNFDVTNGRPLVFNHHLTSTPERKASNKERYLYDTDKKQLTPKTDKIANVLAEFRGQVVNSVPSRMLL